ncbi:chaplin [Streptomyces uncialis]|uniref:chaplin n=1 Tax=Streptomyces uncialis TaxID=1048205 RepID=UPI003655B3A2
MRQALSKGMLTAAAATSILSLPGGHAFAADADAAAVGSPGVLSGNTVSAPVTVPVNVSGNSVNGVSALNPTFGNTAVNETGGASRGGPHPGAVSHRPGSPHDPYAAPAPAKHAAPGGSARPGAPAKTDTARTGTTAMSSTSAKKDAPARPGGPAKHAAPASSGHQAPAAKAGGPAKRTASGRHAAPARPLEPVTQGRGATGRSGKHAKPGQDTLGGGSAARGAAVGSPGVLAGNLGQVPLSVPVNLCGNTVNVIALLNPAFGTFCGNSAKPVRPVTPVTPVTPPVVTPPRVTAPPREHTRVVPPRPSPERPSVRVPGQVPPAHAVQTTPGRAVLADTGAGAGTMGAAAASLALLVGGGVLYRRATLAARR